MISLRTIVEDFAHAMSAVDRHRPQHVTRKGVPYRPGIGPFPETSTVEMVARELRSGRGYADLEADVRYPERGSTQRCDLCTEEWAIEVKMLRLFGDDGKPNDDMLTHILSPYPSHRSALTDCVKLGSSGIRPQRAVLIYAYEYPEWPSEPALAAFERLAEAWIGPRESARTGVLIHPVHAEASVHAWELAVRPLPDDAWPPGRR